MTPCLSTGCALLKKRLPPSVCGHPLPWRRPLRKDMLETDTRTIDQAVGWETDPNSCAFSIDPHLPRSANTDLGVVWVGLLIS